jgi:hypothetical protein
MRSQWTCLLAVLHLLYLRVIAVDYYVDQSSGSDTANNGLSSAAPFKTINKCASVLTAGGTCWIRQGTYRETIKIVNSGTKNSPIAFKPLFPQNESVVVSGFDVIPSNSWSVYSGNIFQSSSMSWSYSNTATRLTNYDIDTDQILVNGEMMVEARWPNIPVSKASNFSWSDWAVVDAASTLPNVGTTVRGYVVNASTSSMSWFTGGTINVMIGIGWQGIPSCNIDSINASGAVFFSCTAKSEIQTPTNWTSLSNVRKNNFFFLWGKLQALDYPGEWFRDNSTGVLYLWTPNGDSPANYVVEARRRKVGFNLNYQSYIIIEGVDLIGAHVQNTWNVKGMVLRDLLYRYAWHTMDFGNSKNQSAYTAIYIFDVDWLVEGVTFRDSAGGFLNVYGTSNVTVRNNVFFNLGYGNQGTTGLFPGWGVIRDPVNTNIITNNTVFNVAGVSMYLAQNCDYFFNDAYNDHLQLSDVGTFYCVYLDGNGSQVAYNWGHDCKAPYFSQYVGCMPFYLDLGCSNYKMHHNVAWNSTNPSGFFMYTDTTVNAQTGNVFAYNSDFGGIYHGFSWPSNQGLFSNNLIAANIFTNGTQMTETTGITLQDNYVQYHPFANPFSPNFDFTLQSSLPVSTRLGAPYDNLIPSGKTPDKGAYDSSRPTWIPGARISKKAFQKLALSCQVSGSNVNCQITNIPIGFRLAQDFQIQVGNSSGVTPVTCKCQYLYETHISTGICSNIPIPSGISGYVQMYIQRTSGEGFVASNCVVNVASSSPSPSSAPTTKSPTTSSPTTKTPTFSGSVSPTTLSPTSSPTTKIPTTSGTSSPTSTDPTISGSPSSPSTGAPTRSPTTKQEKKNEMIAIYAGAGAAGVGLIGGAAFCAVRMHKRRAQARGISAHATKVEATHL